MTVEPGGSGAPMSDRMQSLLSRAVEDQLSEQRQIAGVLTDLRAQLQRIHGDLAALREQSQTSTGSDAALSTVSADVREAVRLLGERIDGVARLVQQRGSDLAELRGQLEQMQGAVRGQGEALGGLNSGLAALPAFGERIGGLQDNLSALHERLAGLDALSGGVGTLQQRVDAVDQGLRDLRSAFAAIGARMAELPGRGDLDAVAQRSSAPVGDLAERVAGVEQAIKALSADVAAAVSDEDDDDDDNDDDDAGEQVAALRTELARFAAAAREDTDALEQRLTSLDQRLAEVVELVTPEEGHDVDGSVEEQEDVEDPVLTELAELREALLGEDGLAGRLDAADADDLDERVSAAVEQAVAASEQRLSAHIDEAVLALAEALLRRRASRPVQSSVVAPPAATVAPSTVAPADDEATAGEPAAGEPAAEQDGEPDVDGRQDEDGGEEEQSGESEDIAAPGSPWQTPMAGPGQPVTPAPEDANRRRRPWWRPGD